MAGEGRKEDGGGGHVPFGLSRPLVGLRGSAVVE